MRVVLGLEYDGSSYHGWQKQPHLNTVQGKVEEALSAVANHPISICCAGRTDTGVHASGQVIHFDTTAERNERSWVNGTNHFLPKNISIQWACFTDESFHARFSVISRRYRYLIFNHSVRPALFKTGLTWHFKHLDHELMQQGGNYLLGEHDFTSFRALECQARSPIKIIQQLQLSRLGDIVCLDIQANGFLHHMVRNIVGVLFLVGTGMREPAWVKDVLAARNRSLGGVTAPPYGLYLSEIIYPEKFHIPAPRKFGILGI